MTFSLNSVIKLPILDSRVIRRSGFALLSGVALVATGCAADGLGDGFDRDPHNGGEIADPNSDSPPPPIIIDPDDAQGADPVPAVFAAKQANPSNLIVTDESLYWVQFANNEVTLNWMHVDGGDPVTVGTLDSLPFSSVADDAGIYFAASSEQNIVFAPHLGLEARPLHASTTDPLAVQVTDDFAYWTAADGCVFRGAIEGGDAQELACGLGAPVSLSLVDGSAYWTTTDGALYRTSLEPSGAVDKLLSDEDFSAGIVADESGVYWADAQRREVLSFSFDTGAYEVLASSQYEPAGVTQDRFYLYFTTQGDGGIKRVLKSGNGEMDIMAKGQAEPGQVVATEDWLYWINEGDGSVMRLLKNYNY